MMLLLAACAHSPAPLATGESPSGVVQSPLDRRAYEVVTLDNGLRALLISDPDTDMAAAALYVHVGHYADPPDRHGLAHFLEHMLFMGTDRYPDPSEYRAFVEAHGGQTNAGTGGEQTQYYFQIEHGSLAGAFDRFARFFVAPLLDPAYVERERNAVNSEYSLKRQDNARRARQVRKATTNPSHPESQFSVGSLDTLADRPGDPVYEDLRALYEREYRADRMTVAVIGREPLDVLRQMVRDGLSDVKNPSAASPATTRPAPFTADQLGVRIDVVPLDVRREVELQFVVPPERAVWPRRPVDYVTALLGHEGEGTLFAALKAAGWIESLAASTADGADDYDLVSVNIGLTEPGASHVDEIVAAVFTGIDQIRAAGPQPFRVHENRNMRALGFQFAEETNPVMAVRAASEALWDYPAQHVLDAWAQVGDLDAEAFGAVVDRLTPDNLRLIVTLPDAKTDRVEPLYEVPWAMRPLSTTERAAFVGGTGKAFSLPPSNPYLPERTSLARGASGEIPALVQVDDRVHVWHLQDTSFGVPRTRVVVDLWSDDPRADFPRARVQHALLERQIDDALQEFRYPLEEAGLYVEVSSTDRGLTLAITGYNDGIQRALADLVARVASFQVDPARFDVVRARAVRSWQNQAREWPITQLRRSEDEVMNPYAPPRDAAISLGSQQTAQDLQTYAAAFFDGLAATVFIHGNTTARDAEDLGDLVKHGLLTRGAAPQTWPGPAVRLVDRPTVLDVPIDHADSAIVLVYQGKEQDLPTVAKWMLLGQLLDTPFFSELRTEQQLGYNVYASYARFDLYPGLRMGIQSGVASPITLLQRIDTFLAEQRASLPAMDPAEFATVRDGLVAVLRERDTQLIDKSQRLLSDLRLGHASFDREARLANAVAALDRDTMAAFAEQILDPARARVVVRSFGRNHTERDAPGCPDLTCVSTQLTTAGSRSSRILQMDR